MSHAADPTSTTFAAPAIPLDRLGRPLHDLRISVMDRCNFRCPYCMPKEQFHEHYRFLKSQERLSFEEIVRLARLFASLGVRKLRLTGGEPLLRANLADLVGDLTGIPEIEDIALTTNGVLLAQHAVDLHANGLKRVTVSLDTLDKEIFARMSGGFARARPGTARHRCRDRRRACAGQDQRGHRARRERSHRARSRSSTSAAARDRALHRVHGRRQSQ